MDHLLTEILHAIFIELDLSQRITCTLVCRHWYSLLNSRSLLYDVHIYGASKFDKFKKMIECVPSRGTQVEKLSLESCLSPDFDRRVFLNIFPNLREITISDSSDDVRTNQNHNSHHFKFAHQNSMLEYISDDYECELTCQLAASDLCGRLKVLDLNFWRDSNFSIDVIPKLVNMPVLEKLAVGYLDLTILDLETIHTNLPSVKSFDIKEARIKTGEMPLGVKPATSIIKIDFFFEEVEDLQTHIQLYHYFSLKYPNLTTMDIYDIGLIFADPQSDYLYQLFENGILSFLRVVGSQLNHYKLQTFPSKINVFKKMDDCGIKMNSLGTVLRGDTFSAFTNLAQSMQSVYINRLELEGWMPDAGKLLKNMTSLETLKIQAVCLDDACVTEINLCQILEPCQTTLSDLTISFANSIFIQSIPTYITSIVRLDLSSVDLNDNFASLISNCFPKLEVLSINGRMSNNISISLPKNHLKKIDIITACDSHIGPVGFLIKTTDKNTSEYYSKTGYTGTGGSIKATLVSSQDYNDPLTLTLLCATVEVLYLKSYS